VDDYQNQGADGEMTLTMAWHSAINPFGVIYGGKGPLRKSDCNMYPKKPEFKDLPVANDASNIGLAFNPVGAWLCRYGSEWVRRCLFA
jgi:hypothetical protein